MKILANLLLTFSVMLLGCQPYPDGIQEVLERAGSNRPELEKVIQHYKSQSDSLKLQAVYYLIKQLPNYVTTHYSFVDHNNQKNSIDQWDYENIPEAQEDLKRKGLHFQLDIVTEDIKIIRKEYIISNVDLAFEVWRKYPWCQDLSFNEFRQQILPHKFNGDSLDDWRSYYLRKYERELDSLKATNATRKQVCFWFNTRYQKKWIKSAAIIPTNFFSFNHVERLGGGTCDHLAKNAVQIMRACGIPLNLDIIPFHGKINGGHAYNSLYTNDNEFVFFSPYERSPERRKWRAPRVFRQTYEAQFLPILESYSFENLPPGSLGNPFFIDVTNQYFPTKDIVLEVSNRTSDVFLCTYNEGDFSAVIWGRADNGKVEFTNVTKELLYFPMYYEKGNFVSAAAPFILREDGNLQRISSQKNKKIDLTDIELLVVNNNVTRPKISYSLLRWNGKWEYVTEEIATSEKDLNFNNIPLDNLYLVRGTKRLEIVQRPFTYFNNKIEYW